jgi:ribosome-binding protein aMBF1 (putative translation factor)
VVSKLAQRIVAARDRLNISDAELARRLRVPRSQVHDWVHGEHEPNLRSLRRLAKVLGTDLAELLAS